jgi:hypothetical protein
MKTVAENIKVLASLGPDALTANTDGGVVDTMGYDNLQAVIAAGAIDTTDTDETYAVKLQEGAEDDGSDMADVTGASVTITESNQIKTIGVNGLGTGDRKRYVRLVLTVGGTTPSIALAGLFNLGRAAQNPAIVPDAVV